MLQWNIPGPLFSKSTGWNIRHLSGRPIRCLRCRSIVSRLPVLIPATRTRDQRSKTGLQKYHIHNLETKSYYLIRIWLIPLTLQPLGSDCPAVHSEVTALVVNPVLTPRPARFPFCLTYALENTEMLIWPSTVHFSMFLKEKQHLKISKLNSVHRLLCLVLLVQIY